MQKVPMHDLPDTEVGSQRDVIFKFGAMVGVNSISSYEVEYEGSGLTFGTGSKSGLNVTIPTSFTQTGTHIFRCKAVLASEETAKLSARVKVVDSLSNCRSGEDY